MKNNKEAKSERIYMRLTAEEKKSIEQAAKSEGFGNVTEYLLFLAKNYGAKIVKKNKSK
jgi:uncharacterized protein (DUF1778 family)